MVSDIGDVRIACSANVAIAPSARSKFAEQRFSDLHRLVVEACRRYGTVGPLGESDAQGSGDQAESVRDPDFYVVEEPYGDEQRLYVEPKSEVVSAEWMVTIAAAMRAHPGWDVVVSLGERIAATVSGRSILITGWESRSEDLPGILESIRQYVAQRAGEKTRNREERLTLVSRLIPAAWDESASLSLVTFFRTTSEGLAGDSLWLLHYEERFTIDLDKYRFEPDAVRPTVVWARRSGELVKYVAGGDPAEGEVALLAEWALVTKGRATRGAASVRVRNGARAWQFDLRSH
jgi:hypothetical protein